MIYLDGGLKSTLDFQEARKLASNAIEKGLKISFFLDLGLFSKLEKPLSNPSQFLSLTLSLKHFKETLFEEFKDAIEQVVIYEGSADFAKDFVVDQENFTDWLSERGLESQDEWLQSLYCRDAVFAYLHALTTDYLDSIPFSLKLDRSEVSDPVLLALLTHKEVTHPFHIDLIEENKSPIAICLPAKEIVLKSAYQLLEEAFSYLIQNNISYRLIPESMLITEWDLVDYLFVLPNTVTATGKRMLQGFVAAGGTVVPLGDGMGLANEITFHDFLSRTQ